MEDLELDYVIGDWIVHSGHGVGQILAIETKSFGGKETIYYRIQMEMAGTLWVPVENDGEMLRPVASREQFEEVLSILNEPSDRMNPAHKSRLNRIRQAIDEGTSLAVASVIRDLWVRQKRRGELTNTEHKALRKMKDRLLSEWAASMGLNEEDANDQFLAILEKNLKPPKTE